VTQLPTQGRFRDGKHRGASANTAIIKNYSFLDGTIYIDKCLFVSLSLLEGHRWHDLISR